MMISASRDRGAAKTPFCHMPLRSEERFQVTVENASRFLRKLEAHPSTENVHRFRTHSRRIETILQELVPDPSRNQKKLLKQLGRLRKKAGRIRDLNIQIAAVRNLKMPQAAEQKAKLLRLLVAERSRREEQISRQANRKSIGEILLRLKRATNKLTWPSSEELLRIARAKIEQLDGKNAPPSDETMHSYRIIGKRARYLAELAAGASAERLEKRLKRMQDVLGDWHDWWQLTVRAESLLGPAEKEPVCQILQSVVRAKFGHAVNELNDARKDLQARSGSTANRKKPMRVEGSSQAAVA